MKRAEYAERGPVPQDVISCVERETPAPGSGEVLLEVLAAPINPSDVLTLTGQYGMLPPLPAVGGNEGIGRVAALGDGVTALAVGQRVLLPVGVGTWASHVIATAALLIPLPDAGDPVQLSMLVVNPPTASLLLSDIVALEPGDWVIQNAANSAVGGYVVQLAKRRGLRTVNVVRREGAIAEVEEAGGDVVLLDGPDLAKRIAQATERARIKLGIDAVGGKATDHLAQSVAIGGTVVNYGGMSGVPCSITPGSLIFRNVTLRGFWLANWFRNSSVNQQKALFGELAMLVAAGELSARVHATYPLEQIKDAIAAAASGERVGKIVLVPTATPR
jgi:NADPH:quinone reductase-like Zn-dependent oxidoreductase